jgi:hypothetical protein
VNNDVAVPSVYEMWRRHDVSGISGKGRVAFLTEYPGGKVTLAWCSGEVHSVSVYDSLDELMQIHGHDGATVLVQIFPDCSVPEQVRTVASSIANNAPGRTHDNDVPANLQNVHVPAW